MRYWAEISVMCISFFFLIFFFPRSITVIAKSGVGSEEMFKRHEENA